jgi:uncharacterized CHY-type Zn-finger protein
VLKGKHYLIIGAVMTVVLVWLGNYYYNTSVHKHISITDIIEIQTYRYNQQVVVTSDKEKERIVKGFNSIKSIKRQNENFLPACKIAQAIIIKLKTGNIIQIHSGYAVGAGFMINTDVKLYSGESTELEEIFTKLHFGM